MKENKRTDNQTLLPSASTTSLIQSLGLNSLASGEEHASESRETSRHLKYSPARSRSERQLNFEGFRDDDDMITLESQSTLAAKSQSSGSRITSNVDGRRNSHGGQNEEKKSFIARMETMLDKVEESIHEKSRPSDEYDTSERHSGATSFADKTFERADLEEDIESEEEEEGDDDSTNVVATQVASPQVTAGGSARKRSSAYSGSTRRSLTKPTTKYRPSHVLVDNTISSPAHTNITMDVTMMNETVASVSMLGDDDNSSTVTPILDRYRLDPDDNSIGIKVVPNKRGATKKDRRTAFGDSYEKDAENSIGRSTFLSPSALPGSVSARKKKQYRKTPFPKKMQGDDGSTGTWDENWDPNRKTSTPSQKSKKSDTGMPPAISVPPLRPRSFGPSRTLPRTPSSSNRALSLPSTTTNGGISRTPLTDALKAKYMLQTERCEGETVSNGGSLSDTGVGSASTASPRLGRNSVDSDSAGKWMEKITMAEYDRAPRVVKTQVTRDEANMALSMIETFLTTSIQNQSSATLEFTEQQGYKILKRLYLLENGRSINNPEQKCKTVLMSLCHWRRLLLYRDAEHGMIFAVNQFEQ